MVYARLNLGAGEGWLEGIKGLKEIKKELQIITSLLLVACTKS